MAIGTHTQSSVNAASSNRKTRIPNRGSMQDFGGVELGSDVDGDSYGLRNETTPNVSKRTGKRPASGFGVSSGEGTKSSKSARTAKSGEEKYVECVSNLLRLSALKIQKEEQWLANSENQSKYGPG